MVKGAERIEPFFFLLARTVSWTKAIFALHVPAAKTEPLAHLATSTTGRLLQQWRQMPQSPIAFNIGIGPGIADGRAEGVDGALDMTGQIAVGADAGHSASRWGRV